MSEFLQARFSLKGNVLFLLGVCLCVYFLYHAVAGQRSLLALHNARSSLVAEQDLLKDLRKQSTALEKKVTMLRADTLDLDYVEELAVKKLGYKQSLSVTVLAGYTDAAQQ